MNMKMCRALLFRPGLAAVLFLLAAGCNKPAEPAAGGAAGAAAGKEILVGEFASLTGSEATFGNSSHNGTLLAIEEANAAPGGVLGGKVKLLTEDDQSKAGQPSLAVLKLITRDEVKAVLGEVASSRSIEAGSVCQDHKIPMVSPASTNPKVTEVGDYIFRVCFMDRFQASVMANFSRQTLKLKKLAILKDVKSDYSMGLAKFFNERFTADGGQIVAEESFSSKDKDFKAQLTSIKAAAPDGVFVPGYYTEAGLIVKQARELGITAPLMGGDGWESDQLIPTGGEAMDGCYFSTHYSPESQNPVVQNFVKKYKAQFGAVPDAMAALGYDSGAILMDAMKRAGSSDSDKIRDALAATKNFVGVTGTITIDPGRNASKSAVILEIKGGKFALLQTVNP
jgi:branched-chain amino acid transport system substrate-binding protein